MSRHRLEFCCPRCGGHSFGSFVFELSDFRPWGLPTTSTPRPGTLVRQCGGALLSLDGRDALTCEFRWPISDDWRVFAFVATFETSAEYKAARRFELQLASSFRRIEGESDHAHAERAAGAWMDRCVVERDLERK